MDGAATENAHRAMSVLVLGMTSVEAEDVSSVRVVSGSAAGRLGKPLSPASI